MMTPAKTGAVQFWVMAAILCACWSSQEAKANAPDLLEDVSYQAERPLIMNMTSIREISAVVRFNTLLIPPSQKVASVRLRFKTSTVSPQFNILSLNTETILFHFPASEVFSLHKSSKVTIKLKLHANYIGHAILQPESVELIYPRGNSTTIMVPKDLYKLPVTIVQYEGIWGTIFIVSVSILIVISYINLGAQLDEDNMRLVIKKPKTLILGSIISTCIMPAIAWFVGIWFFRGQPLFRIGSFIFASGPAASASTLWTVMLNSDKELSIGLQVISTVAALVTMPLFLYSMENSLNLDKELYHHIRVPYSKLIQTLLVLLMALIVGWRLGRHKRAKEISRKVFRPLVFFVLIFIIVFSTILYWHIYQMFDWNITLACFIITMSTYIISGLLGHLINCDLDRGVAISITSAYKNSGIAFAVLLVAFEVPDTYIAFVPCLTQVVTTSLTLYLTYAIVTLVNCFRRRGQPDSIQATSEESSSERRNSARGTKPDSDGDEKTAREEENDEFIAMDVTYIDPESPPSGRSQEAAHGSPNAKEARQISVKVVATDEENGGGTPYSTV